MLKEINPASFPSVLIAFFAATLGAAAEPKPCDMPMIFVETDDQDLHQRACKVVNKAMPAFEACSLKQNRSIIFRFSDSFSSPYGVCLGLYHKGKNQIDLLTPMAFQPMHAQSEFCEGLPEDRHFDSIILHELAHALVDQASEGKVDYVLDQEYIAYAMQFEIMQRSVRDTFLSNIGITPPIDAQAINEFVLLLSPSAFAASAWLHFSDQENGCAFVDKLIQRKVTFFTEPY